MHTLLWKEIRGFFSSLTGYIVIAVFLLTNSLFIWIFPGSYNVLDNGYANLDGFFSLAPWIFLFLIPAVTMRMFAEEKRSGTFEVLMTRPLTDACIILAKFFSGVILVFLSIIPSLIFFLSVYFLGNPIGNLDIGGIWGSFIGLFFLASSYVAIGIFASALVDNQIVSFILSLMLCFLAFMGMELISPIFSKYESFIVNLGIQEHYTSMSRGVIDSRDLVYFLCLVSFFIVITRTALQSRKW